MKLRVDEIAKILGGRIINNKREIVVKGFSTDSRTLRPGSLFIALKGNNFDGHDYVNSAFRKGAVGAVVAKEIPKPEGLLIIVRDTLYALGEIASRWRVLSGAKIVAITGSNGKTTTKEFTASVLSCRYNVLATEGNLNNLIGVPLMLFRLRPRHEFAVLELGTSRVGEIRRLTEITKPNIGIITNIGRAHLEYFKTLRGVLKEKVELAKGLKEGLLIYNGDDELLKEEVKKIKTEKLAYGFSSGCDIRCVEVLSMDEKSTAFRLKAGKRQHTFRISMSGRHNIYNALAGITCGLYAGIEVDKIYKAVEKVRPLPGRGRRLVLPSGLTVIDDSYNANPESLIAGLREATNLYRNKRITAVLGDMLELGERAEKLHFETGKEISNLGVYQIVTIGRLAENLAQGAVCAGFPKERVFVTQSKEEAIKLLKEVVKEEDVIYVKGSRGMKMEEIIKGLEEA